MSDRKYRQRGYQDEPRERQGPREKPATPQEPRAPGRPLQHASGPKTPNLMGSHEVFRCARCGNRLALPVPLDGRCARCGADLHSCGNCRFFDTTTLWECRENIPVRVAGKHAKNECTFFQPKIVKDLSADKPRQPQTPDDARKAFEALFKK